MNGPQATRKARIEHIRKTYIVILFLFIILFFLNIINLLLLIYFNIYI
jgi:preprotein translocase subunit SecE